MWHENPDPCARTVTPTVRYTRNAPSERWLDASTRTTIDEIAGFTPDEDAMVISVHEAAHAVFFMAAGHAIDYITVYPPGSAQAGEHGKADTMPVDSRGEWPWLDFAILHAGGERAADRYLRESRLWTPERAWAIERSAVKDRAEAARAVQHVLGRAMTYGADRGEPGDYAWICDQTDQALSRYWPRVLDLGRYVFERRRVPGADAARVAGFAP